MAAYSVYWHADVEQDLAAIWLAAPDRKIVTQSVDQAEQWLSRNPYPAEVREREGLWLLRIGSMRLAYEVDESRKQVRIVCIAPG